MAAIDIQDITFRPDGSPRLGVDELAQFAVQNISISDTETTGLNRDRNGLTEIASIRGIIENGEPRLKLFHSFVLPLKPCYRDYLEACEVARIKGSAPPIYDRRLNEYSIEPAALAVTGTEILRKRKDGPITGLKVDGKRVTAKPFYEMMEDFLSFTRNGENDVYYNAPFDRPFLGSLIADVRAYSMAMADMHRNDALQHDERLTPNARGLCREYAYTPYRDLTPSQQQQVMASLRPLAEVPESYTNPALYQCLYYGFLAKCGFGPSNTLDDATRLLVDAGHTKRGDHSGIEDVIMAARIGLRLDHDGIADMAHLYDRLLKRVDPAGSAGMLASRLHRNGKESVYGDIALQFSRLPSELGEDALRFWQFLAAFHEAPKINSRVPQHLVSLDAPGNCAVVNAERKQPLSLNFLKKCLFFTQMLDSPVLYSMLPYDSTGNRIDVVLRQEDPATGKRITVEDVHYGSLRANVTFLESHAPDAAAYLRLISRLRKTDRSVGMVLLKDRTDGGADIVVKGHLRAFGECVLRMPAGIAIEQATPSLINELEMQISLGVIPQVGYFGERDDDAIQEEDPDELSTNPRKDRHEDGTSSAYVESRLENDGRLMALTLSASAFIAISHRIEKTPEQLLASGSVSTANGSILLTRQQDGTVLLRGPVDAFYDFIQISPEGQVAEKPSNLIRDASWLLYRLERIPGTYGLKIEGDMAVLGQRDGIDIEALGLLYHVGIPFKAYGTSIKVDIHQLMKNAFHWSLALSRAQKERKEQIDAASEARTLPASTKAYQAPQGFLISAQQVLLSGKAQAMEMNEKRDVWLLDHAAKPGEQPHHHPLNKSAKSIRLVFKAKRLLPECSDVKGPHVLQTTLTRDGGAIISSSPVLLALAAARLTHRKPVNRGFIPQDATTWRIPPAQRDAVLNALHDASRFLYTLGKQTGSERLTAEHIELRDNGRVAFHLPVLRFLHDPALYRDLLVAHTSLSDLAADKYIRTLHHHLPNPRRADTRRGDVMQMTSSAFTQLSVIDGLNNTLNMYLRLLGGAEHEDDPSSLQFSGALRDDLATLGSLLHERAATPHKREQKNATWHAVQAAQEKLSSVAFGSDQLREDLAVARKALTGGAEGDGGLRARIGHVMGTLMLDATHELAHHDPSHFSDDSMAAYRTHVHDLLGEDNSDSYAYYARHAAMRYLIGLATSADSPALQSTLAHYFLSQAFPAYDLPQRESLIALYREGSTPYTQASLRVQFLKRISKHGPTQGDILLHQHHLLTHPAEIDLSFDAWYLRYPDPHIDAEIIAAYQRRGRLYLDMAHMLNIQNDGWKAQQETYLQRARDCLRNAGWSDEKFEKARERTSARAFSSERRSHVRAQMALTFDPATATVAELISTVDHEGNEQRIRSIKLDRAYKAYKRETSRLVEDVLDPYYMHKQRMALLGSIEKSLKETHDLLMVKYHHVRDLQGLLVLLQQDPSLRVAEDAHPTSRVGEIGRPVSPTPELAGIKDDTLRTIQDEIKAVETGLRTHFTQHLAQHNITAGHDDDHTLTCDLSALQRMFSQWQKEKPKQPIPPLPDHLYPWLERASQRLFRVPHVESVRLDKTTRYVECRMHLPTDGALRAQAWARLRLATVGLGLRLPAMPNEDSPSHLIQLQLLNDVQRGITPLDAVAKPHHLREALGAFAVQEGMPANWERSFVSSVMKRRNRHYDRLDASLQTAGEQGADLGALNEALLRYRQR